MNTYTRIAATLYPKPLSTYLSIINQKRKIMSDFDSILKAEGLELEKVVEEISETNVVSIRKTSVSKPQTKPKRSPGDPDPEPEDMDIVEMTTETTETHTGVKKATAVKAKPAPKS